MGELSTIGFDFAKRGFQIHGIDSDGAVVIRARIRHRKILKFFADLPARLVGIEACPTARHRRHVLQWLGRTIGLMAPSYVKAYVKRAKTDAVARTVLATVTDPHDFTSGRHLARWIDLVPQQSFTAETSAAAAR